MIGQSFAPLPGGTAGPNQPAGGGHGDGPQEAINVLRLRFPKLFGAGAPAPSQLLTSPGSAALPQPGAMGGGAGAPGGGQNPAITALLTSILGAFSGGGGMGQQAAPSAPGGSMFGGGGMGMGNGTAMSNYTPAVHYQPPPGLPGGTAGPGPQGPAPTPFEDRVPQRGGKFQA